MRRRAIAAIAALTATLLLITALRAHAHPLHTTLTEIVVAPGNVRATVRLFADDFANANRRSTDPASYVSRALTILDGDRALVTRPCGIKRTNDLVWVCIEASLVGSGDHLALRNALFGETYKDQINIVQATRGATKRSLVFAAGDDAKRLF